MSALSIQPTYPIFTETDGQPLEDGYIRIGTANLDPQVNPINVYWDAALTISAPQPIRTINGYPSRNGTPGRLYVNSDYSIRVQNSKGSLVYSAPAATERYSANLIAFTGFKGQTGTIEDLADDDGADWIGYTPSGVDAEPLSVQDKLRESVSIWDFIPQAEWPALQAGTSTYDCFNAMTNAINTGKSIEIKGGTFPISGILEPQINTIWFGDKSGVLKWSTVNAIIYAYQVGGWSMDGIVVDGNYTAYPIVGAQKAWGIEMDECNNVTIQNCVFRYLYRIGICIGHQSQTMCQNIVIDNNVIHDCGSVTDPVAGFGNGVAVLSASNVKITNNRIYNITGSGTGGTGGINLEPGDPAYNCYDIEIAGNKVTNCNNCGGIQLYMGHPTDFTGARGNINIHDNTIAVTGTAPGITCTQFGDTYIRNNQLELTQGILVKRYKAAKAIVEGNVILQVQGAGGYGIRFQDGIASAIVRGNRMTNINGIGIEVNMYDFTVPMDQKECLIQDNSISSCVGAGIAFTAGNFVISGNTLQGCASPTDYYIKSLTGGVFQSVNGYIGGNTLVSASGSIAAFINIEGDLMDNVQIGPNSYVGPILPTMKTNTFSIGGRNPGVFMDVLPAAGTWQVGDIIWKATPAPSGFIGWVCTTAGTPGTWKQFGTIQA